MKISAKEELIPRVVEPNLLLCRTSHTDMDRLAEYAVEACEDLFQVDRQSWFDGYSPQTVAHLLENEERFREEWGLELGEYYDARENRGIPMTMRKGSKPQPPKWLYPQIGLEAAYRSISKNLMIALSRRTDEPQPRRVFWEMRQYLGRAGQAFVPEGPLMLQKEGRYDKLLVLCQSDMNNLSAILPEDMTEDLRLYSRSVFRYRDKYFVKKVEKVGKDWELVWVKMARWH